MGVAMGGVGSSAFSSLLRLFFQGKNESKRRVAARVRSSFFFSILSPAFSEEEKEEKESQKAEGLPPVVIFSERKEGQKTDGVQERRLSAFSPSLCLLFFFKGRKGGPKAEQRRRSIDTCLFTAFPSLFYLGYVTTNS